MLLSAFQAHNTKAILALNMKMLSVRFVIAVHATAINFRGARIEHNTLHLRLVWVLRHFRISTSVDASYLRRSKLHEPWDASERNGLLRRCWENLWHLLIRGVFQVNSFAVGR